MQLVDFELIQEAIQERDERYAVLCVIQHITPSMVIYDAASYEMLFALNDMRYPTLLPYHFKQLGKKVGKE